MPQLLANKVQFWEVTMMHLGIRGAASYALVAVIAAIIGAAGMWLQGSRGRPSPALDPVTTHGEWVKIKQGTDTIRAYVAYPERKTKAPAVIVIHEIFGLTDWEPTVADRLAKEGFVAIVPDLLSSKHGQSPEDPDEGRKLVGELEPERITADLDATYGYVNGLPAVEKDRIGTIGFCWGGGQSFRYATNNPNLKAAVVAYGPPPDSADIKRIQAPVLGIYGENDERINRQPARRGRQDAVGGKDLHPRGLPRHRPRLPQARTPGVGYAAGGAGLEADPRVLPGAAGQVSSVNRFPFTLGSCSCLLALLQTAVASRRPGRHHPSGARRSALRHHLVPSDTGTHVLVEVQTTWRLRSAEPVEMELDSAMRVVRVLVDGKPNTRLSRTMYGRSDGEIEVPHEKHAGDTLTTRVRYHGQVRDGLIIGANQYGDRTIFADNWPDRAHLWLASQDHPSDKATVAFHVQALGQRSGHRQRRAGEDRYAGRMGTQSGTIGWTVRFRCIPWWWESAVWPAPRCRMGTAQQSCIPVTVWTYPEDSAYAVSDPFRRAAEIVRVLTAIWSGPFPYGSLAHVESSTRFGGMENSTAIFYDEKRYRQRNLGEPVVAHETAHQWFGDAVTEGDWHHLWLSEGFATYLAALWQAHADGDSAFRAGMRRMADEVFESKEVGQPILDTTARDLVGLLNSNNYQKGAWVLHQLRGLVGDSAFFSGLRHYYSTFRDSTALSADFARIMSEAAGRDLDWYFRQALTQPGYPVLDLKWTHKGKKLTVDITQTQPAEWGDFQIPSLILLVDDVPVRLHVQGRQTRQIVEGISHKPKRIEVDPKGWWLLKATVSGDR